MLQQILLNTPVWVWALLAFLVYRGLVSSVDREVKLKKLFIIPAVMLVLSLQGIVTGFGASAAAAPAWLAGTAAGTMIAWALFDTASVSPHPERDAVAVRGSWLPMMLMLAVFCTKYIVGATLAMNPELAGNTAFAASVCTLYGLFNGMFVGRLLRVLAIYRAGVARTYNLL